MILGEYLDEHDLDFEDVVLKKEDGEVIINPGCLINYCDVLDVNGNELTIR